MNSRKGFTLIELLVVISIISLLSSITIAVLSSTRAKARDAIRKSDIYNLNQAITAYNFDHDAYPIGTDDYAAGLDSSTIGTFLTVLPNEGYLTAPMKDPGTFPYWYAWRSLASGNTNIFNLYCPGGTAKAFLLYILETPSETEKVICYQ
jgi:prepilin-type N-terminal cleavage/methylation domain-containing protein